MFKSDWSRTAVAVVAAVLMSGTCLMAAVGPAQPGAAHAAAALAARVIA